ncbi:MAG TPA: type II asparaginase [Thermoanaerobaculaceae bacterium]|nr:type II asparaginase [Thermoanaerobaculaceae bacterium]
MSSRLGGIALALAAAVAPVAAQPAPQPRLPNVTVLATGGTIAGTGASSTTTVGYKAATLGVDALIAAVPELAKVARISGEQVFQIASENMTPAHWLKLAKRVNELLARDDVDGIVITHGTDTLEETAYFLDLVVKSSKPVVLVGAMRPATALSADGPMNLLNAVALAASAESAGRGVMVCLNDQINAARDVTKTDTSSLGTFQTPELGMLGVMEAGRPVFYRAPIRAHTTETAFDVSGIEELPKVGIVLAYAGSGRVGIDAMVAAGMRGIVHAGTGNGSLSNDAKAALVEARAKGIVVVRASRIPGGAVARNGEADDDALDFVVADNLSPQKARVLLTLALTRTTDTKEIQAMFRRY